MSLSIHRKSYDDLAFPNNIEKPTINKKIIVSILEDDTFPFQENKQTNCKTNFITYNHYYQGNKVASVIKIIPVH